MNIVFILLVVGLVAYAMLKKLNPQATLMVAGLALLAFSQVQGLAPVLPEGKGTGLMFFDLWQRFTDITNFRLSKVGLTLVSIAGVSTYLTHIGASQAMVRMTSRPIMAIRNPYTLLAIMLVFVFFLYIFITGATSLSLLLMGTLYPVMRNAGISARTAIATIVIPTAWEFGPGQMNAVIGAEAINVDVMDFVINHQSVVQLVLLVVIPFVNILWQRHCDRQDGYNPADDRGKYLAEGDDHPQQAPAYYAFMPVIPFVLLFGFSDMFISTIKMNIPIAMMTTISICMVVDALTLRSVAKAFDNFTAWLNGTGMIFGSVLTLMLAAEFFSAGLTNAGAISGLINFAEGMSLGPVGITVVFSLFILLAAFITGSGNAPVMAFIPIVPMIAENFAVNPLMALIPILFAAGIGRTISPVAGVIITVAGMGKITPLDVVRRTFVPMIASMILVLIASVIMYT